MTGLGAKIKLQSLQSRRGGTWYSVLHVRHSLLYSCVPHRNSPQPPLHLLTDISLSTIDIHITTSGDQGRQHQAAAGTVWCPLWQRPSWCGTVQYISNITALRGDVELSKRPRSGPGQTGRRSCSLLLHRWCTTREPSMSPSLCFSGPPLLAARSGLHGIPNL